MRKVTVPACIALGVAIYRAVVEGDVTLDFGIGRRLRPLGPLSISMASDRETIFDVIASPYLGRTPRALGGEIEVLERCADMVLAAHRTPAGLGLVTTTVETVRFERPHTVSFRLVRGPVPHVVERFSLQEQGTNTHVEYTGELGTDFWAVGGGWGEVVARRWVDTVQNSLERVRVEAERRAGRRSNRAGGGST